MAVLDPREKTQQEALEAQRANTAAKEAAKEAEAAKAKEAEAAKKEGSGSTPAETEQEGPYYIYKKPAETSTYPVSFAKNLMGGNVDVISQLNEIKFEQYDGSLKNAIAYIVPWKRDGVSSKTQAQNAAPNLSSLPENLWTISDDLGTSFSEAPPFDYDSILQDTSGLGTIPTDVPAFDPNAGQWYEAPSIPAPDYNQAYTDTKGSTPPASGQESAADKQKSLGSEIPVGVKQGILTGSQLLAGELLQNNPEAAQYAETALNLAGSQLGAPSGPIYIGNEDGTLNQVISGATSLATTFGMNVPTGLTTTVKPDTQPKTPKDSGLTGASVAAVADGAWQFLFNPQELSLTAGPDFASAEAWGVMDGNNSGQPLHFTKMKNPELKFSRVLLNGYVFGRQVESLEQGLFKLFSEIGGADNGVQTGPQVLEFIWGKKTFGPCVIKDIQVTEKMWDDGLLVNAEVSFTLVKVPEWTVNDGQVSVYAPGTIDPITAPTAGDTGIGQSGASNPASPDTTEPKEAKTVEELAEEAAKGLLPIEACTQTNNFVENLRSLSSKANLSITDQIFRPDEGRAFGLQTQYQSLMIANQSVLARTSGIDPKCSRKCNPAEYYDTDGSTLLGNALISCVQSCSNQVAKQVSAAHYPDKCNEPQYIRPA